MKKPRKEDTTQAFASRDLGGELRVASVKATSLWDRRREKSGRRGLLGPQADLETSRKKTCKGGPGGQKQARKACSPGPESNCACLGATGERRAPTTHTPNRGRKGRSTERGPLPASLRGAAFLSSLPPLWWIRRPLRWAESPPKPRQWPPTSGPQGGQMDEGQQWASRHDSEIWLQENKTQVHFPLVQGTLFQHDAQRPGYP